MPYKNTVQALFILTLTTLGVFACSPAPQSQSQPPAPEVDIAKAISATVTSWDEYSGRFQAVNEVEIRARVSGYVESVKFIDGQFIQKNDVLFVIDQRPFQIALDSANARYNLASKELNRARELRQKNSISQEEVDQRINEVNQAQAELNSAKLNMEFTEVKSPISGLVGRDLVNVGNLISATEATLLTTVVSISPIHFYFQAGESEFLKYSRASQSGARESSRTAPNPVRVKLQDEKDFVHLGKMDFVDNQIDRSTGTIEGRAILDNEDGFLLPGIFGRIQLLSQEKQAVLLLPDTVFNSDQSKRYVYIIDENNTVKRKYVELGKLHTPQLRIVESGLDGSENVVVSGLMRVRDNVTVSPNVIDLSTQYSL